METGRTEYGRGAPWPRNDQRTRRSRSTRQTKHRPAHRHQATKHQTTQTPNHPREGGRAQQQGEGPAHRRVSGHPAGNERVGQHARSLWLAAGGACSAAHVVHAESSMRRAAPLSTSSPRGEGGRWRAGCRATNVGSSAGRLRKRARRGKFSAYASSEFLPQRSSDDVHITHVL